MLLGDPWGFYLHVDLPVRATGEQPPWGLCTFACSYQRCICSITVCDSIILRKSDREWAWFVQFWYFPGFILVSIALFDSVGMFDVSTPKPWCHEQRNTFGPKFLFDFHFTIDLYKYVWWHFFFTNVWNDILLRDQIKENPLWMEEKWLKNNAEVISKDVGIGWKLEAVWLTFIKRVNDFAVVAGDAIGAE